MAETIVGLNDPKAVKRYSGLLAVDIARDSYFNRKFMGNGEESLMPIQRLTDLENDSGDKITFDLVMQLRMQPVEGDAKIKGKEEKLQFYTDTVNIDQMRGGVNAGGRMSRKRTLHDIRKIARARSSEWWARVFDELFFMYLSGARGVNADYIYPTDYTGFANNAFSAPDSEHLVVAGGKAKATLLATDIFTTDIIDRAVAYAEMMGGGTTGVPKIVPCPVEGGEKHFVIVMNPWQAYNLRTSTTSGDWLDIQKAAATAEGRNSIIFKGGLGMHNNVILHKHQGIIRFTDYGAGGNVEASRALFLGAQAAVCAFGSPGSGLRFGWTEETDDRGNEIVINTHTMAGIKKTTFNAMDFGVMALDTAAKKP